MYDLNLAWVYFMYYIIFMYILHCIQNIIMQADIDIMQHKIQYQSIAFHVILNRTDTESNVILIEKCSKYLKVIIVNSIAVVPLTHPVHNHVYVFLRKNRLVHGIWLIQFVA